LRREPVRLPAGGAAFCWGCRAVQVSLAGLSEITLGLQALASYSHCGFLPVAKDEQRLLGAEAAAIAVSEAKFDGQ